MSTERITPPAATGLRVAFQTFGCRSNYADTVDLQAAIAERGAVACTTESAVETKADVYVINTCTVTDNADKEALRLLRRLRERNPNARIVVTGCLAEVGNDTLSRTEDADAIIGPGRRAELLDAVLGNGPIAQAPEVADALVSLPDRYASGRRPKKSLPQRRSISLTEPISQSITGPGTRIGEVKTRARFHLRIQEGCENSCTFCIIPQSRGRLSSRPLEAVLDDVRHLERAGYREIVLTGTHIGGYGEDRGYTLFDLLQAIERLEKAPRIRLSSIDPNDLTENITDLMAKSRRICHYLHVCVQAFADSTLKRMNRRYRLADVITLVESVRQKMPACTIGTDVIAGFPGESRQEVDQAMETFLRLPFSYLHVFPYSERSGTAATALDGTVAPNERKRRAARWRTIGEQKKAAFLQSLLGKQLEVVVESKEGRNLFGTSREFAQVEVSVSEAHHDDAFVRNFALGAVANVTAARYCSFERKLICEL